MTNALFYIIAGIVLGSAFLAVTLRNLFHCALFLALAMFGVSGIFLYLNSEFLAAVQVLIYVGAVTILIIFGIMLTRDVMNDDTKVFNNQRFLALITSSLIIFISLAAVNKSSFQISDHPSLTAVSTSTDAASAPTHLSDVYALGPELIRPDKGFAFSFEFVSILLLSALVGAIVVARKDPS